MVDSEQSYRWLKSGDIMGETESTIVAAQDQVISTNYFKNKILKQEIESKCRLCKQHEETIDHLTSGCSILAKNEYLMRHDKGVVVILLGLYEGPSCFQILSRAQLLDRSFLHV